MAVIATKTDRASSRTVDDDQFTEVRRQWRKPWWKRPRSTGVVRCHDARGRAVRPGAGVGGGIGGRKCQLSLSLPVPARCAAAYGAVSMHFNSRHVLRRGPECPPVPSLKGSLTCTRGATFGVSHAGVESNLN